RMRYSTKWAHLRIVMCIRSSAAWSACGNSHASTGTMIEPVCVSENALVDATKIQTPHAMTGAQRPMRLALANELRDRLGHQRQRLVVEFGVDEALDLLALRSVALAARGLGELRAGEEIEVAEHGRLPPRVAARELAVEGEADGQEREAVFQI